jgi:hypothetical protein
MKYEQTSVQRIRRGALSVRACLGIVVTVGTAACAPSPNPTHQTVDYYRADPDARKEMLAKCENDPGALGRTPDCINALQAKRMDEPMKSLRDLPPLGLVPNENGGSNRPAGLPGDSPRDGDDVPQKGE